MNAWRLTQFVIYGSKHFGWKGYEDMAKAPGYEKLEDFDLKDRNILVTGANSGIGFSATKYFAKHGATVHMICRNEEREKKAQQEVLEESKNENVHLHICDVSDMDAIRKFTDEFIEKKYPLDVLINNAGVLLAKKQYSAQKLELALATNTVSNYLLTTRLLPVLKESKDARVIFVSSGGGLTQPLLIEKEYEEGLNDNNYDGEVAYSRTKRHQLVFAEKFATEYKDSNILFVAYHPGWSDTPQVRTAIPKFYETFKEKFRTSDQGADTMMWLAVTSKIRKEPEKYNGQFFRDRDIEIKHLKLSKTAHDPQQIEKFWTWVKKLSESTN